MTDDQLTAGGGPVDDSPTSVYETARAETPAQGETPRFEAAAGGAAATAGEAAGEAATGTDARVPLEATLPPAVEPAEGRPWAEAPGQAGAAAQAPSTLESQPLPGESAAWIAPPAPRPAGPRWRWIAALLVTVAVVATAAGAALVMSRGSASPVIGYVPASTFMFMEARLDTPGSQGQALASFLAHFPGFKDSSTLQVKLSDTWDRLLRGMSGDKYAYSTDLAPWAEGTVAISVLVPKPGGATSAANTPVILYVAVKDQAKARAEVEKLTADAKTQGSVVTSSTSNGVTVWSVAEPSSPATASVALLDGMLVVTTEPSLVQTVQDVKAGKAPNLGSQQAYVNATSGASSDRLASMYISYDAARDVLQSYPTMFGSPLPSAIAQLSGGMFGTLRADSDRLTMEFRGQAPSLAQAAAAPRTSTLIDRVPATTLAYFETHDIGKALAQVITEIKAQATKASPSGSPAIDEQQLGQIEALMGGQFESFASWMGDGAVAIGAPVNGTKEPFVAFVATVQDTVLATERIGQLTSMISMLGSTYGLSVTDSTHGSAKITTLEIPSSVLSSAAGSAGETLPGAGSIAISWTLADGRFILASSKEAVGQILDVQPGQGLGSSPSVQDAIKSAGGPAVTAVAYVDLKALRAAVESAVPGIDSGSYKSEVQPYLVPFDRFVGVATMDGSTIVERGVVTLSNP